VPKAQPLAIDNPSQKQQFNQSNLIQQNKLATVKLLDALKPLPLAMHNDKNYIDEDVLANMNLHSQIRYKQTKEIREAKQAEIEHANFNAIAWLNNIQNSRLAAQTTTEIYS
jgi:hypothetical protein